MINAVGRVNQNYKDYHTTNRMTVTTTMNLHAVRDEFRSSAAGAGMFEPSTVGPPYLGRFHWVNDSTRPGRTTNAKAEKVNARAQVAGR